MPDRQSEMDRAATDIGFKILLVHVTALLARASNTEIEVVRSNLLASAKNAAQNINLGIESGPKVDDAFVSGVKQRIEELFAYRAERN